MTPLNTDVRAFSPLALGPIPVPVPTNNRKIEPKIIKDKKGNDHADHDNNTATE